MTERTLKQDLTDARLLITPREKWTQGRYARNGKGEHTTVFAPDACCWCISGAVIRVAGENADSVIEFLKSFLPPGTKFIPKFNDYHTHDEALSFLDRAIEAAP